MAVDLGTTFDDGDPPDGYAPAVLATDDAARLVALSAWPRMVTVVDGCDLVPVARVHPRAADLAGSVRLTLARRGGTQATFLGACELCVVGPLPSRWWGWRTRDGAPVLHREHGAVDVALAENGLVYDGREDAPADSWVRDGAAVPDGREVLLLGGPADGQVLTTRSAEIETSGVFVGGVWHRPGDVDPDLAAEMVRHVFYRVRRAAELDVTGPWWDASRLAGREWVATFEGERTDEHVQPGGEADPDEILVDIVAALQDVQQADASALVEQGLAVLRALERDYTIHPRETA